MPLWPFIAPWGGLVAGIRQVYAVGAKLGLLEGHRGELYAPMPEASW